MNPHSRSRAAPRAPRKPRRDGRRPEAVDDVATPAPTPLTPTQRRYLRGRCHDLKPLVLLGNKGVTESVRSELERTLRDHELVKVKLSGNDRVERQRQVDALIADSGAELVQQIGHIVSLFRRNPDHPGLALPP